MTVTHQDRIAPDGKYRVVLYDSFDNDDCIIGDYVNLEDAKDVAEDKGGEMTLLYVFDDTGKMLANYGSF